MARLLPISITVTNPDASTYTFALCDGGMPFAEGEITSTDELSLKEGAAALALQARPLAFWPDGSVKWALLTTVLANVTPGQTRTLTLGNEGHLETPVVPWTDPAATGLTLTDTGGTVGITGGPWSIIHEGPIFAERVLTGYFNGRDFTASFQVDASWFPAASAWRYRIGIKGLENFRTWSSLVMTHPHLSTFVHRATELGATAGTPSVTLINAAQPVDDGAGRTWEIWGFESATPVFVRDPFRFVPAADYVRATGAMGRLPIRANVPAQWTSNFDANFHSEFDGLAADPLTSGWFGWGAMKTRLESDEYLGFYSNEYDWVVALMHAWAVTGELEYLDQALECASFYRDANVAANGGCFQHRAPLSAILMRVAFVVGEGVQAAIETFAGGAPIVDQDIYDWSLANYGQPAADDVQEFMDTLQDLDQERRTDETTMYIGARFVDAKIKDLPAGQTLYEYAQDLALDAELNSFGYTDADADFVLFFARYGGDWNNIPRLHADYHMLPEVRHTSSHTLVESMALAYWWTGDENYFETARRTLSHQFSGNVIDRAIQTINQNINGGKPIILRELGWALINLTVGDQLTFSRHSVNAQIVAKAAEVATEMSEAPVTQIEGSVHAGIAMEGLAYWHAHSGSEAAGQYLVELAAHWARTQWDPVAEQFVYRQVGTGATEEAIATGPWSNGLCAWPIMYAFHLSQRLDLAERAIEAWNVLLTAGTSDGKDFAQKYRNTWRMMDFAQVLAGGAEGDSALAGSDEGSSSLAGSVEGDSG